ncbi:MAG: phosphotransferase family protein [Proteobacteria bacterium]|nr:phosphotransferase family protein [Pseudomonadota bacterium]
MPAPRGRDFDETRQQLAAWLHAKLPRATELSVSPLSGPAATGFSNDTLLFDLESVEDGRREHRALVARIEPTGFGVFPSYDLTKQYRVMAALRGTDVPVPQMFWFERDKSVLGAPFYVMERVAGRIPTDNPPYHAGGWMTAIAADERSAIWWSGVDTLAAIHRCDPVKRGIDFLDAPPPGADTARWPTVARWETQVGRGAEHVAFWEAFTAWRFAVIMVRVGHQMQSVGVLPADSTFPADNTASRLLARTLDLPPPT